MQTSGLPGLFPIGGPCRHEDAAALGKHLVAWSVLLGLILIHVHDAAMSLPTPASMPLWLLAGGV